jgi:capsular polysaccharide transport system permease protein
MMPLHFMPPEQTQPSVATFSTSRTSTRRVLKPFRGKGYTFWLALLLCLLAVVYWGFIASDRYVSEAHVIIQQTDMAIGQSTGISSLLGMSGGANRADQLLLRDHLLSVDMLEKLDKELGLREHYSDRSRDLISRMWSVDISREWFHRYYLSRVAVEFDEYAGVLVIRTEAFNQEKARAMTTLLMEEGERYMNTVARRLAQEQVSFLETQVGQISERVLQARQAVLAYQNERNLVSPQGTAENVFGIINQLEGQLTTLNTQRGALLGYLNPQNSSVVELNLQIASVKKQIARQQARLTSSERQTLNHAIEEFTRLQMIAEFAQDMYKTALAALEKGRIESMRTVKMVSVIQSPTQPQYPMEPRRIYNTAVFIVATLMLAGIVSLLSTIIREHRD